MSLDRDRLAHLQTVRDRLLWLSCWTVHNANALRPKAEDEVKVGGHQASSASMVALMTALYFHVLRAQDRVAVKPHASPVFHAAHYLMGNQSRAQLEGFRAMGRRAVLPVADQGCRRRGFLHRLCRAGSRRCRCSRR